MTARTATALLLAAGFVFASCPVAAHCVSLPDSASTGYVENGKTHMLCLQRELALETEAAADRARNDAELGNLRIQLERQQQLILQQQSLPAWPQI